MRDIVKGANKEILEAAERLGYTELIVVVETPTKLPPAKIKLSTAYLIKDKELAKTASFKNKYDYLIGLGTRSAFENKHVELLLPDLQEGKDHTHYRQSGMDQIYAKIAKTKRKTILFDFSLLQKNTISILGRMQQNARLCKKYGVAVEVVTFADKPLQLKTPNDLKAMARILT